MVNRYIPTLEQASLLPKDLIYIKQIGDVKPIDYASKGTY